MNNSQKKILKFDYIALINWLKSKYKTFTVTFEKFQESFNERDTVSNDQKRNHVFIFSGSTQ